MDDPKNINGRVLLIEDNGELARRYTDSLTRAGFEVHQLVFASDFQSLLDEYDDWLVIVLDSTIDSVSTFNWVRMIRLKFGDSIQIIANSEIPKDNILLEKAGCDIKEENNKRFRSWGLPKIIRSLVLHS